METGKSDSSQISHKGLLRYLGLWDWWITSFSIEEREDIVNRYTSFGIIVAPEIIVSDSGKVDLTLETNTTNKNINYLEEKELYYTSQSCLVF